MTDPNAGTLITPPPPPPASPFMTGPPVAPPPPPLPPLPPIPDDGDAETVALGLLKTAAGPKLCTELATELARLDQMTATSLERVRSEPPATVHSVLRTEVPRLVRLERSRRLYRARQATLGGPAVKETGSVAQAVAGAIMAVRDVSEASERIRQHEASKLPAVEQRIASMLHTSGLSRTAIGPFVQDPLVADLILAVGDRAKIVRLGKASDPVLAIVEHLSPSE